MTDIDAELDEVYGYTQGQTMSREIKFKVYVESIIPEETGVYEPEFISGFLPTLGIDKVYTKDFKFKSDTCKFTLLQYTGLKDKDGVEIYEGDLVRGNPIFHKPKQVFYHHGSWLFSESGKPPSLHLPDYSTDLRVIGNIYENPELLEAHHDQP